MAWVPAFLERICLLNVYITKAQQGAVLTQKGTRTCVSLHVYLEKDNYSRINVRQHFVVFFPLVRKIIMCQVVLNDHKESFTEPFMNHLRVK